MTTQPNKVDVVVLGGGQSGLAVGYYLRRINLSFIILDEQEKSGGAWQHAWESLQLFSPADHSSLPGWLMPRGEGVYPTRVEAISYLTQYETRYGLPIVRQVKALTVVYQEGVFQVETTQGVWQALALVSAT
jgi:putative flavoprotein involved in K+ transport